MSDTNEIYNTPFTETITILSHLYLTFKYFIEKFNYRNVFVDATTRVQMLLLIL